MRRLPDWGARLATYLEPLRLRPFAWGEHDCCTFAAGAVEAMTGTDPMPAYRGTYSDAVGAARALRKLGQGTLSATLDALFVPIAPALAQRGDIVMTSGLLGICWGGFAFVVGREGKHEGLMRIDRTAWVNPRAWRVQYGF